MCPHTPPCPTSDATDAGAAHPVAVHFEQGWTLLCNAIVLFDDTGAIRPDLEVIPPRRAVTTTARREKAAA
ncbi:hypothetical protein GCM10012285_41790 [Streptomyces kronopolitis]|uniref:Uncharacterized protein n=1 Tax=Streptomyces kronopolitis TaxID=1612435 RepID=A0ABQ2JRB1_9ACTN|nr:DUF5999 family protein [Streptomyces kronopolitis]GGN51542.1 hypothetical protein GCM10012285_41790 [Streptomyces kronopolitis]